MKGLLENIVKYVGFAGAIVSIAWFAIANPDIVNQQFYDAMNRLLPFLMLFFGMMAGWSMRDGMKNRDAEVEARIRREDAEHAEKMRREQEEHEAEKAREAEKRARRTEIDQAAMQFKTYEVDAKALACRVYDEGEFVFDFDVSKARDIASSQIERIMERETLPEGSIRYTLKPMAREMLDAHPELLKDIREYIERNRQSGEEQ